jgi:hypothetical protein
MEALIAAASVGETSWSTIGGGGGGAAAGAGAAAAGATAARASEEGA